MLGTPPGPSTAASIGMTYKITDYRPAKRKSATSTYEFDAHLGLAILGPSIRNLCYNYVRNILS